MTVTAETRTEMEIVVVRIPYLPGFSEMALVTAPNDPNPIIDSGESVKIGESISAATLALDTCFPLLFKTHPTPYVH